MIVIDESQTKCIQYQEEIDKLQKEIEKYQINLEVKEKHVNESKHFWSFIIFHNYKTIFYSKFILYNILVNSLKEIEICELEKKFEEQSNNLRIQFNEELNRHKNEFENEKLKLILSHDQQIVELQKTNKLEVSQIQKSATEKQSELTQKILVLENESDLLKSEKDLLKEENQRLLDDKKLYVLL